MCIFILFVHIKICVDLVFSKQLNDWEWTVALICGRRSLRTNSKVGLLQQFIHVLIHSLTENRRCIKSCVCVALGDFHQFLMRDYLIHKIRFIHETYGNNVQRTKTIITFTHFYFIMYSILAGLEPDRQQRRQQHRQTYFDIPFC